MRILVVEDVHSLADSIAEGLRNQGFAVDVSYDGLEAAVKLDTNADQVVVLDRDLPGIHGDALCRMITEADRPTMVLMLTAADTADDRISGLDLGADDYLPKPFHFTELVLRICALARRQPTARPRVYRTAGLNLDPQQHTATRDGRPLELSVKEFAVLEALLRAAPAVLSAEDLLEQVWDEHTDPFTNTIFNTLSRLRRKLGNPPLIETQSGVGYRISDPSGTPSMTGPPPGLQIGPRNDARRQDSEWPVVQRAVPAAQRSLNKTSSRQPPQRPLVASSDSSRADETPGSYSTSVFRPIGARRIEFEGSEQLAFEGNDAHADVEHPGSNPQRDVCRQRRFDRCGPERGDAMGDPKLARPRAL
ncbi:MAG TPA: response regulator transcription factor [Acidimicrobiales bacterium]